MEKFKFPGWTGALLALAMGAFGLYALAASKTNAGPENAPADEQHKADAGPAAAGPPADALHPVHVVVAGRPGADLVPDAPGHPRPPAHPPRDYAPTAAGARAPGGW